MTMVSTPAPATATAAPSTTSAAPASGANSGGPCLFIGIDGTVAGSNVHLLLLAAAEHNYTRFAPLGVQAIVANRFTPIVANDGTRALGESGLIQMSFAIPPSKIDLFGQSLVWLRLSPRDGATAQTWQPAIGGIHLNAVYAKSTETLTRELLGSADGSPNLTVTLARPPVLDGTLELRVREPLGDQELKDLNDRGQVVIEGSDYWVLWKQVDDTTDQPAGERVYSLDESTGEIRFGDGVHGMIPPIGRDSIVAFSYQRTEPPAPGSDVVPANGIPARTTLNLVSPVETVESVTTAADSAGGSAPENNDTVLQFGYARLRHRERAVTLEDFEDLALESSPSIAQAHAFQLSRGRVQVILVMRGNPVPTLSQIRELHRYLLSQAPPALALPEALTVSGPVPRELRIQLKLDVETLDQAAGVSVEVNARLKALFDTVTGNLTQDGWPLGLNPAEDVVASKISDVPGLASTTDITFFEVDAKGNELQWPEQINATDLVVLADDPVRLEFRSLEVEA
jgi:predicted phage baseplate assembly protein